MSGRPADDLLVVAATDREAAPFRSRDIPTVVSGIGRVNAAVATTLALGTRPSTIVSAGIAGSLPPFEAGGSSPSIGSIVIGDRSVYAEEGMISSEGFTSIADMGFPLAAFAEGNSIRPDQALLDRVRSLLPTATIGGIATVATCSGTDVRSIDIANRTAAVAEAMEGAAVLHAARLLGATAIEIRTISNRTGERAAQGWDLDAAFSALETVAQALGSDRGR